jgi:uncharacterized protein
MPKSFEVKLSEGQAVTALGYGAGPKNRAGVTLVLGHGAGAGQTSEFMVRFATGLAERGIDVVTFNFLYAEQGRRAPDRGDKLEACFRAVINAIECHKVLGAGTPVIGGKSLGGRIASQVAAKGIDVAGLVFLGYPLHPPGKPDRPRSEHLSLIRAPMLFIQGTRDPFGTPGELRPVVEPLKSRAVIYAVEGGDHSLKVPKSSPVSQEQVYRVAQDEILRWVKSEVS